MNDAETRPAGRYEMPGTDSIRQFPFDVELNLTPLIRFWEDVIAREDSVRGQFGRLLVEELRRAPELSQPVTDLSVLTEHSKVVQALMTAVFPAVFWDGEYTAALIPFQLKSFYSTPAFQHELMGAEGRLQGQLNIDKQTLGRFRLFNAYAIILGEIYGISFPVDYPLIFTVEDRESGLDRHFKISFDGRFIETVPVGPVPALSEEAQERLKSSGADLDVLAELIPASSFRFRGFTVFRALEVTDQEVLSSLKRDLIEKESIVSQARFEALQSKLRTLFHRRDLRLGLAAIDGDRVFTLNYGSRLDHECIFADSTHQKVEDFEGSIYMRATLEGKPLFIDDLTAYSDRTEIEEGMLAHGVRNIVVAPLLYQDQTIGSLSLSSPHPGDITALQAPKLQEILPLFSMAVKRSMDELESRIQALIKEKCTNIHPVVEWRFREAVLNGIERQAAPGTGPTETDMEEIVFRDVHPLYAIADIRGSSTQRSWSIQADLLTQLGLARDVLRAAHRARTLPILDQLGHRIDVYMGEIEVNLRSGDEMAVVNFVRSDIESLFDHLASFGPEVRARIEAYRGAVDPQIGMVYAKRRDFEESVTVLTDAISAYVDLEEHAAQAMYPHYFEKQKTDGVDYSIYAGGSLLDNGAFDPLYLRNLRLWQLMVACGIAIRADRLKERLAVPLEVANLILVQHQPLAIRFRVDEKRFDVDGAYNVRYEIIKKRIDKAVVRGTAERLTQPGKIALVYSQTSEAIEWRHYIEYLQRLGYLTREVEDLELEELPGAQGLRALRVTVDLARKDVDPPASLADFAARAG